MSAETYPTYLDEAALPYFFCPGCGHGQIVGHLNAALVQLQLDPHQVVIVTDIGCSGLADKYFVTNAFHGLHGRSITYASGIKLANPDLKVIVLMGDGGCGIGGHHLINAARRNIGVTVIVFNNLNYGMTGGEHSVTTPPGGVTSTTLAGQLERPLDICQTVAVNGAGFAARTTSFDQSLPGLLAQAIQNDGFSVVDIWELCTAYYAPNNRFSRKALEDTLDGLGFATGIVHQESRPEYSRALRQAVPEGKATAQALEPQFKHHLDHPLRLVLAGAAGKKINSAAAAFCRAAVLSGLWATQRNDYPVTVKSGHSTSEVILSPERIGYTGIEKPDAMLVLFKEGLANVRPQISRLTASETLYLAANLPPVDTSARTVRLDFKAAGEWGQKSEYWAIMALARWLADSGIFPFEVLRAALSRLPYAQGNLAAVDGMLAQDS